MSAPDETREDQLLALARKYSFRNRLDKGVLAGPVFEWARGSIIRDVNGKEYLDYNSGQMCSALGHNHPRIAEALRESADTLIHASSTYFNVKEIELAARLGDLVPRPLMRSMFLGSGADSNEGAITVAKKYTGGFEVASPHVSFHGMSEASRSVTYAGWHSGYGPTTPGSGAILAPYCYRCPVHQTFPACELACLKGSMELLDAQSTGSRAAIITEPLFSAGGVIEPPPGWLGAVKRAAHDRGMLLIFDEAQTGLGKLGTMFACEQEGVIPDIMTLSKHFGGGVEISAIVTTPEIESTVAERGLVIGHSHTSDPLACNAALASLAVIVEGNLPQRAADIGRHWRRHLEALAARHEVIGDIRGRGLIQGIELVRDRAGKAPFHEAGPAIARHALERGLLFSVRRGGSVLRFVPPFSTTSDQLDRAAEILDASIAATMDELRPAGKTAGPGGAQAMTIRERYQHDFGTSAALFDRARAVIAGGITHDGRYLRPFPVYIARARGSRKWDVEGREYIDYWMGHGALLLGHGHPAVVKAIQEQAADGLHYGGCHELEVRWAELICRLVPCAERVRFTNSGSEATHLASRLARAWIGRSKIVKLEGHFHGWHDNLLVAVDPPFAVSPSLGVPPELSAHVLTCPQNDLASLRALLDRGDVAGVVLEPSGASFGTMPIRPDYLKDLRALTAERRVALIFDEVVTGFRYAPGGAQEYYGVTPDLAAFGKIVSGGLTAGVVAGRGEILDMIAYTDDAEQNRHRRVSHRGTFSASPIVAAAGIACLELVADGKAIADANRLGAELRRGFNEVIDRHGLPMAAYGDVSSYHVCLDHGGAVASAARFDPLAVNPTVLKGAKADVVHAFRIAMLIGGVDSMRETGFTSAAYTELDVELTIEAFDKALTQLKADRLVG